MSMADPNTDEPRQRAPIERKLKVTPETLREPLTTIDVESARDERLNTNFDIQLEAETNDANTLSTNMAAVETNSIVSAPRDENGDLVTGMGGADDVISEGVEVPLDLEDMSMMRDEQPVTDSQIYDNETLPQTDMAPTSGQAPMPREAAHSAGAAKPKAKDGGNTSGGYTEHLPQEKADSDLPSPQ
jgi:hypothetical protein